MDVSSGLWAQTPDDMKNQLEEEIKMKYEASASGKVEFDAYRKAYLQWLKFREQGKVRSDAMFVIADYTKIRTEKRLFLLDVSDSPKVLLETFVAHGYKSGGDYTRYFSNVPESKKSSREFLITGSKGVGGKVGKMIFLDGQNPGINDNVRRREILFHKTQSETGHAMSAGCLSVPASQNNIWRNTISDKIMIYSHSHEAEGIGGEIPLETAEYSRSAVHNPANVPPLPPGEEPVLFENLGIAKAAQESPSLASQQGSMPLELLGSAGIPFILNSGTTDNSSELPPEDEEIQVNTVGNAPYHGEATFERCQMIANEPWDKVVEKAKSGEDPHDSFKSSWGDLHNQIKTSHDIEDWRGTNMAQNHLALTRECAAMAYLTEDSPLDDDRVNMPQKEKSNDGAIECEYHSAESQDFRHCQKTIREYDEILRQEEELEKKQAKDFKDKGETTINTLGTATSNNKQMDALNSQATLTGEKEKIAGEREEFQIKKGTYLQQALAQFPTRNSLLEKCRSKYKRFNQGGIKEYEEFVSLFDTPNRATPALPEPCYNAIDRMKVKFVQNVKARNQMKKVIRKAGLKAMDYNEKKGIFKNQGNFLNKTAVSTDRSYFFNSSNNQFESCSDSDPNCSKGKERIVNEALSSYYGKLGNSGGKGATTQSLSGRGILDKWTSSGIYEKDRYLIMGNVLKNPTDFNLSKMNNNILEFKQFYGYRKKLGELEKNQIQSVEGYFDRIKKGKIQVSNHHDVIARLAEMDKKSGRRENVIYKKDGKVFDFDINKNLDNSIFKIISNRYNQKILKLEKK